jgi:anti-sigma-K factor RskA
MNLSRPDRLQRLDALAAEYALGTLPPRARLRLERVALDDSDVAAAMRDWELRLAPLTEGAAPITPPPRVWIAIAKRLGLKRMSRLGESWWSSVSVWRGLALASMVALIGFGVTLLGPKPEVANQQIVAVLAGPDAKPALIATMMRDDRFMTVKAVGAATVPTGKALELWMLPEGGVPKSLGLIQGSGVSRVALPAPPDVSLANVPALAVSLEPSGGSTTGAPTGPVLYTGKVERFY